MPHRVPDAVSADSRLVGAPPEVPGMDLKTPQVATPTARLSSKEFKAAPAVHRTVGNWLGWQIGGWAAFLATIVGVAALLLGVVLLFKVIGVWLGTDKANVAGTMFESIGNALALILIYVMIFATLLTLADRKWSALMQDRVGPNRARIFGIDSPLGGTPHIIADVLKMLFKEDFVSKGASQQKLLFNLGPFLQFAPAFMLFAIVPMGPEVNFFGYRIALQVARIDWGILYVFALASLAVFGTALAGWSSDNKLALLGGLRASAQLVSYEVTLGLTLVGAFIVFGTVRLDTMVELQGLTDAGLKAAARLGQGDTTLLWGWLPSWGMIFQPVGALAFLVAALAEIKRAPFDTPEGESEIIGYFLEYSGLKSGMFLIAEYAESVVIAGIITAIFLGGYHIPWFEPQIVRGLISAGLAPDTALSFLAIFQVFTFIVKSLLVVWVMFLIRWAFPRFRYDQIMRLGWKNLLPISLANVLVSGFVFLAWGRDGLAAMGLIEWAFIIGFVAFSKRPAAATNAAHGSHDAHGSDAHGTHSAPAHGSVVAAGH